MRTLYILSNETNEIVATVVGNTQDDNRYYAAAEAAGYNSNDYSNTWVDNDPNIDYLVDVEEIEI